MSPSILPSRMQLERAPALLQVSQLIKLISKADTVLPVFTRLQSSGQSLMLPVVSASVIGSCLCVIDTAEERHSIDLQSLLHIDVFKDSSGKAVFLNDFEQSRSLTEDYAREIEAENGMALVVALKNQDLYNREHQYSLTAKQIAEVKRRKLQNISQNNQFTIVRVAA